MAVVETTKQGPSISSTPRPIGPVPVPPCTLVIFGAGGDLTKRLLMPSLYNLAKTRLLSGAFRVVGVDCVKQDALAWRRTLTETMQSFTKNSTAEFYTPTLDQSAWRWVSDRLQYLAADFDKAETFQQLKATIGDTNAVFYLAVAARFFAPLVESLGKAGLLMQCDGRFRRVVIEKPFGSDLASAELLNARILKYADEGQIYRIDHFLGKDTVQGIMALRFANSMFEPIWRREYLDHVQITAAETVGVESRGAFYESTGALRDMVPNHMFTLLTMVAMEAPNSLHADDVRSEKLRLLKAIRPVRAGDAVRGQYDVGIECDQPVQAYRAEPAVSPHSRTETYVALKLFIENPRWAGVPFYLRTGKRLAARKSEIVLCYKAASRFAFLSASVEGSTSNIMRLLIEPRRAVETEYDVKVPGPEMRLGQVTAAMRYGDFFKVESSVGYETLLYDCMMGDLGLFQRADAIEASWRAVQPLLEAWRHADVETYTAGSQGPSGADDLIKRDRRAWMTLGS